MPDAPTPRLEKFEQLLDQNKASAALEEMYEILLSIDRQYGRIEGVQWMSGFERDSEDAHVEFATRFIAAFGRLIRHPDFAFTDASFERLHQVTRWIELMASLSGFRTADSFIRALGDGGADVQVQAKDFLRLLTLYLPNSKLQIPLDTLYGSIPVGFCVAALGWLGTRYCFNQDAFDRREKLLEWLPGKLDSISLGEITLANVSEPFFHASYALTPRKHEIKADLIAQLRKALLKAGCVEWNEGQARPGAAAGAKPTIVVSSEFINQGHSIHRTHSASIRSLRRKFHVVGLCQPSEIHWAVGDLFDEAIPFPDGAPFFEAVKGLARTIVDLNPAAVVHMAVGMKNHTIALCALRLAPVQVFSYGHMATTRSPVIDYHVLPGDFVGEDWCFSEKLVKLPPEAMPYEPRTDVDYGRIRHNAQRRRERARDSVKIGVPAALMKLNPAFFAALKQISERAERKADFVFFPGFAVGLAHAELRKQIHRYLPHASINPELPYLKYCEQLAECDFTVSPFPYGNMNSLIESVALGLPGVCLDGPESHAHTDCAIYARLGFPSCLNAQSVDDFVAQAVRLIDDPEWLASCRSIAAVAPIAEKFCEGDASLFCDAIYDLAFSNPQRS